MNSGCICFSEFCHRIVLSSDSDFIALHTEWAHTGASVWFCRPSERVDRKVVNYYQ
jgi:hypothetical protein